ncbi:MAG: phosphoribosylformylglycinamidine synthase subunit PurS [Nitrososphaerota archaeon]|nr:phosphoribosylformylglycinamidine synthase subunit PurS [Candidatus Bathyarchaeota archaeon]MCX8162883.1 phosphoribosylformylglycinamidine synthase subunit PurS [Candidatus Bathyarchaeota archaeon]MDW8062017.1 phosphoribosylformylglycinamidine synthase subunit PurS [Nitrososphaerota archaeon]
MQVSSKIWRVYISYSQDVLDPVSRRVRWEIEDMGVKGVERVKVVQGFRLSGDLREEDVKLLCEELLHDPIVQEYTYFLEGERDIRLDGWVIEVRYKPGVFDSLASSVVEASKIIGVDKLSYVETFTLYVLNGCLDYDKVELIARRCLANPIIHDYKIIPPV